MESIVGEFTIVRRVRGEPQEIELKATFEIQEQVKSAELTGQIFLSVGDVPWDGRLTAREKSKVESQVYATWADDNESPRYRSLRDDTCLVDPSFDDFDDDMAIKVANKGVVTLW